MDDHLPSITSPGGWRKNARHKAEIARHKQYLKTVLFDGWGGRCVCEMCLSLWPSNVRRIFTDLPKIHEHQTVFLHLIPDLSTQSVGSLSWSYSSTAGSNATTPQPSRPASRLSQESSYCYDETIHAPQQPNPEHIRTSSAHFLRPTSRPYGSRARPDTRTPDLFIPPEESFPRGRLPALMVDPEPPIAEATSYRRRPSTESRSPIPDIFRSTPPSTFISRVSSPAPRSLTATPKARDRAPTVARHSVSRASTPIQRSVATVPRRSESRAFRSAPSPRPSSAYRAALVVRTVLPGPPSVEDGSVIVPSSESVDILAVTTQVLAPEASLLNAATAALSPGAAFGGEGNDALAHQRTITAILDRVPDTTSASARAAQEQERLLQAQLHKQREDEERERYEKNERKQREDLERAQRREEEARKVREDEARKVREEHERRDREEKERRERNRVEGERKKREEDRKMKEREEEERKKEKLAQEELDKKFKEEDRKKKLKEEEERKQDLEQERIGREQEAEKKKREEPEETRRKAEEDKRKKTEEDKLRKAEEDRLRKAAEDQRKDEERRKPTNEQSQGEALKAEQQKAASTAEFGLSKNVRFDIKSPEAGGTAQEPQPESAETGNTAHTSVTPTNSAVTSQTVSQANAWATQLARPPPLSSFGQSLFSRSESTAPKSVLMVASTFGPTTLSRWTKPGTVSPSFGAIVGGQSLSPYAAPVIAGIFNPVPAKTMPAVSQPSDTTEHGSAEGQLVDINTPITSDAPENMETDASAPPKPEDDELQYVEGFEFSNAFLVSALELIGSWGEGTMVRKDEYATEDEGTTSEAALATNVEAETSWEDE